MTIEALFKDVVKLLRANVGRRGMYDVFTDFVEVFALACRNSVSGLIRGDREGFESREEEFEHVKKHYSDEEMTRFAEAFALVSRIMELEPQDVLGRLYMQLEISDASLGQFYTPYDVAKLMAEMQVGALTEHLADKPFVTVHEPACGAGAMLVAISEALRARGYNPQQQMHVHCEDLSLVAVHMVYIHLTLLHIPAVVARRNTLTMETFFEWPTPAHVLGWWDHKLRRRDFVEVQLHTQAVPEALEATPEPDVTLSWDDVFEGIS